MLCMGKIRDQHALILMDAGSTHNIILFKGQEVTVTPLLRVHVQSFVEPEEFCSTSSIS